MSSPAMLAAETLHTLPGHGTAAAFAAPALAVGPVMRIVHQQGLQTFMKSA